MVEESHHENCGVTEVNNSTSLARVVVRQIIEAGITDVVISPGSRNAPLSLAFFAASQEGLIKIHVRVDERTAAFFALGIIKSTGRPVPVVCTSGTAVANYHPAVLEASHTNAPLMVLTADRPAMLRKTGANQTTDQVGMFPNIPAFDLVSGVTFELGNGPTHLNIQFDEPLLPNNSNDWLTGLKIVPPKIEIESAKSLSVTGNGVIVIGHDHGTISVADIEKFVKASGLPVIAEDPLTFANSIRHASVMLSDESIRNHLKADFAIVIGRTTLSRSINSYVAIATKTYVVDPRISTIDTKRTASQVFFALPKLEVTSLNPSWISDCHETSKLASNAISQDQSWSEQSALTAIAAGVPEENAAKTARQRSVDRKLLFCRSKRCQTAGLWSYSIQLRSTALQVRYTRSFAADQSRLLAS